MKPLLAGRVAAGATLKVSVYDKMPVGANKLLGVATVELHADGSEADAAWHKLRGGGDGEVELACTIGCEL